MSDLSKRYANAAASQRARDITAACELADKPQRAAEFIASDLSAGDVVQLLAKEAAAESWRPHIDRINARVGH
jgi:hypothetical protein